MPQVERDVKNPCMPMDFKTKHRYLIRLYYYECQISFEVFHSLDVYKRQHLDYIVRYGRSIESYSYSTFSDLIDEILRELIDRGKGLELNMAGYKYGLGFGHPHPDILKRYRELGGEIVTVGSDGHRPEMCIRDRSSWNG